MTLPPRFPVSAAEIDTVVAQFYARVRQHDVLAPVFFASIPDDLARWQHHEEKIARFWRNAILHERSYSGNPQHMHSMRPMIKPEHFELWLALFDEVLAETLPESTRQSWSALAHRIGAGLRMGVVANQQKEGMPPILR
ncbi:MAG: group III truncated hemoglobin [Rhodobacteraceae bacterium]|nr:group III truncated hemoglobin [Paracoccaceae bacterium]